MEELDTESEEDEPAVHDPQYFNDCWYSRDKRMLELVDELYRKYFLLSYKNEGEIDTRNRKEQLLIVICNFLKTHRLCPEAPGVFYSRDKQLFTGTHLSYRQLIGDSDDAVNEQGKVVKKRGLLRVLEHDHPDVIEFKTTPREAYCAEPDVKPSFMQPGTVLKLKIELLHLDGVLLYERPPKTPISCREPPTPRYKRPAKRGRRIPIPTKFKQTDEFERQVDLLTRYNEILANHFVAYFAPDTKIKKRIRAQKAIRLSGDYSPLLDVGQKMVRRHFNDVNKRDEELKIGGRFFGGFWQTIESKDRSDYLYIDDDWGVEMDYKSMEPTIAYAQAGVDIQKMIAEGDELPCYELPGYPPELTKPVTKAALLVGLNRDDENDYEPDVELNRVRAVRKKLFKDYKTALAEDGIDVEGLKLKDVPDKELMWPGAPPLDEVVNLVYERHSRILPSSRKAGLERTFVESQVTVKIIERFCNRNRPVLCIHDSYVAHPSDAQFLEHAMFDSLVDVLKTSYGVVTFESEYPSPPAFDLVPDWVVEEVLRNPPENRDLNRVDQNEYRMFFAALHEHQANRSLSASELRQYA